MKDQVLSIGQMRYLRDLGVDTQEASIVHLFKDEEGNYIDYDKAEALREEIVVLDRYYDAEMGNYDHSLRMDYGVFTLQDLLNVIPPRVSSGSNEVFSLRIERCIDEWGVYYTDRSIDLPCGKALGNIRYLVEKYNVKEAILLGGEPLLHPNILGFISTLRLDTGLNMVRLTTNGIRLKDNEAFIKELVREDIVCVIS